MVAELIFAEGLFVQEIGQQVMAVAYQLDNLVALVQTLASDREADQMQPSTVRDHNSAKMLHKCLVGGTLTRCCSTVFALPPYAAKQVRKGCWHRGP